MNLRGPTGRTYDGCQYWVEGKRLIVQCIGQLLHSEDVPEIVLPPEQEPLTDYTSIKLQIEASVKEHILNFDWIVGTILGQKEAAGYIRQARGKRVG